MVELTEEWPDDPRMTAVTATYVRRITEEDLLHRMNAGATPEAGGYLGDAACIACHEDSGAVHEASLHAHAIEVLAKTGREADPDCVRCHVIGYGEKTGFASRRETPGLARVGCESCHGPGREHRERPAVRTIALARDACTRCHTAETDPGFLFEEKWPRIRHGSR